MPAIQSFNYQPNWTSPVIERWQFHTDIIRPRAGFEQRVKLRDQPKQFIEYSFIVYKRDLQQLQTKLFAAQGQSWRLPLWQQEQLFTAATPDAHTLFCETAKHEFYAGGMVTVFSDNQHFQDLNIASVNPNYLTTTESLNQIWGAGTKVFPTVLAHISQPIRLQWLTAELASATVQFQVDNPITPWLAPPDPAFGGGDSDPSGRGRYVLPFEPNWVTPLDVTWTREVSTLDYETGLIKSYDLHGFSDQVTRSEYLLIGRDAIYGARQIMSALKGSYRSFYTPTFGVDAVLADDATAGSQTLTIFNISLKELYSDYLNALVSIMTGTNYTPDISLFVELRSGESYMVITRGMTTHSNADKENLTVASVFQLNVYNPQDQRYHTVFLGTTVPAGFTVSNVKRISFMNTSRLESDVIEYEWTTPGVCKMTTTLRKVPI